MIIVVDSAMRECVVSHVIDDTDGYHRYEIRW